MIAKKTLEAIEAAYEAEQEREHRSHLGASILAKKCLREVWYSWRWAKLRLFEGRMLRLFNRGEREEPEFLQHLSKIGCEVWPRDPSTGNQWRIKFAKGHGGGSADGVARGIPDLPPGEPFLVECKTHSEKYFKQLVNDGLCQAKPEHFGQTQIYMNGLGLRFALYMAVNKNDDSLHLEVIQANPGFAASLLDRAEQVVDATSAPRKIGASNFYLCRFCDFREICHGKEPVEKNCRTCYFSKPIPGGAWLCQRYNYQLNTEEQSKGCKDFRPSPIFKE